MIKRKLLLLISLVIIGGVSFIIYKRSYYDFTIVFTANVRSTVNKYLGYSRLSTVIKNIEKKDRRPLVFDGGGTLSGSTETNLTEGQYIVPILNAIGYSAIGLGCNDFEYSKSALRKIVSSLSFPVISTNILNEKGEHEFISSLIIPHRVNLFKTVNIGVISLITPMTQEINLVSSVEGLEFSSSFKLVQDEVNKLKEKTDFIVLLSHLNMKTYSFLSQREKSEFYLENVLSNVKGIDLVLVGNLHLNSSHNTVINKIPIFFVWEHLKYISIVNIKKSLFKQWDISARGLDYKLDKDNIEQDPDIVKLIEKLNSTLKTKISKIIGSCKKEIPMSYSRLRLEQTDLGRWLADILMKDKDVDISVINAGTIKKGIQQGTITEKDIHSVFPYKNTQLSVELSGKELKELLEKSYSLHPNLFSGFLQISSNVEIIVDLDKPAYSRISSIKISGKKLDESKKYKVLISNFLKDGGDGYTIFKDKKVIKEFGYMDEDLRNYIKNNSPISL